MGKLRKIGKKVSRALNKVFGKKLGSIIGMVGLYMTMSAVGDFFLSKIPTKVPPVEGLDDLEKIKDIEETAKTVETVSNVDEAKKVVDTIKNTKRVELPDCGHLIPIEKPIEFADYINKFVKNLV